jgi:predicted RNase H-like nuclease (RuvC/YqgF family)
MTKADQTRERIDALVADGLKKADAFRQLSEELGQPVKSLQGAYYNATRKANGGSTRARKRETTTIDALAQATAVLEKAIESIDAEIEAAKTRADEAKAEHEALKSSATERKQAIQAKIEALRS